MIRHKIMPNDLPSTKKRILVLTSTYPRWQSDTVPVFVAELCRNLSRSGYEVDVVAPHSPGAANMEMLNGVRVYRYRYFVTGLQKLAYSGGILANLRKQPLLYFLVPFFLLFQLAAVRKRLKAGSYDLIHAHWVIPQGLVCALANRFFNRKSTPILCTSHGADLYSLNNFLCEKLKRWTIKESAFLTVVSRAMLNDYLERGIDKSKLTVISMGVDLKSLFVPASGIKRLKNRIIFVGRMVEKKGVPNLIEAMKIVAASNPDIELLLVGDGPLRKAIAVQVEDSGLTKNIVFNGAIGNDRLPALYSTASVAVVPSIIDRQGNQEGLGLVMVEAMGCGCAVVASSLEPIKDVIVDGVTGLLSTPGNSRELAEKILLLLTDPALCRRIADQGQQSVRSKFDWGIICEKYQRLINSLCV